MLRRLLACLALLTGLAAAGAPAQAEVAAAMTARFEAGASASVTADRQSKPARAFRGLPLDFRVIKWDVEKASEVRPAPAVRIGSDRARE